MKPSQLSKPALWLVLAMLSALSTEFYTVKIWAANQPAGFSDLYASWWAAHELLLHGRDPYSSAISHEIQTGIYGTPVDPSPEDPTGIGGGFAYPPHAAILFWPLVYLTFPSAQKVFLCVSLLGTLLSLTIWMDALGFRRLPLLWLSVTIFTLGSFPALQAFKLQNPSLIAAALIALTLYCLSSGHFISAGIFLSICTFKPQFTVALIPWLALWTIADWRRRRSLAWSFLATMLLLGAVSAWLVPGWMASFLTVIRAYRHYTYGHSVLDVWFTPGIGSVASALLLVAALTLCRPHRSESPSSPKFLVATSLILAATVVVIPTLAPHAQLLLLPGFLCLLRSPNFRWAPSRFTRTFRSAGWMLLAWPWIAAVGLFLAAVVYPTANLLRFWEVPLYTSPLVPLAVLLALSWLIRDGAKSGEPQPSIPEP
jgi:hypothetical protein